MAFSVDNKLKRALFEGLISIEDYVHLKKSFKLQSWYTRSPFDFENFSDRFCIEFFRFTPSEIDELRMELLIPDEIKLNTSSSHLKFTGLEGICILLARLASPSKLTFLTHIFHRDHTTISRIFNYMIEFVYSNWKHLLNNIIQEPWLNIDQLQTFSEHVTDNGSPIPNIAGFLDGTGVKICRPKRNQHLYYSGHHRCHVVKYQAVTLPNGLILRLDGPFIGKVHDARMLRLSGLPQLLIECWKTTEERQFRLYGDKGYAHTPLVCSPYRGNVSHAQELFNLKMSEHRVHAEYGFGRILKFFPFTDYVRKKKILLMPVNKIYKVATILTNCHSCIKGSNQTSLIYDCPPPSLNDYLSK